MRSWTLTVSASLLNQLKFRANKLGIGKIYSSKFANGVILSGKIAFLNFYI